MLSRFALGLGSKIGDGGGPQLPHFVRERGAPGTYLEDRAGTRGAPPEMRSLPSIRSLAAGLFLAAMISGAAGAEAPSASCTAHVAQVERYYRIPDGLLLAMAYVESAWGGTPWPWTLNVDGEPRYLSSPKEAIRLMRDEKGRLKPDVAVGCLQIYMRYHAENFPRPEDALVPRVNVAYGGWYLRDLYERYGSWTEAVGRFHARNPVAQRDYVCRVLAYRIALGYQRLNEAAVRLCRR